MAIQQLSESMSLTNRKNNSRLVCFYIFKTYKIRYVVGDYLISSPHIFFLCILHILFTYV